jgi:leucyl/phenylalanyl-tRNA--protein transferase
VPVFRLPPELQFPDPDLAEPEGLLAVGGDLSPRRLLLAYSLGIFPWYSEGEPILWWSPDPRLVLEPSQLHVSRSLRRTLKRGRFELRLDTAFDEVVSCCAGKPRPGQDGTWITSDMARAYGKLHELGHAHSAEAFQDGRLVGGLYGVSLGGVFFGESMFTDEPDASKAAFVALVEQLERWRFGLIDCQMHTEHLVRFGAVEIPRSEFQERLDTLLTRTARQGRWRLEEGS